MVTEDREKIKKYHSINELPEQFNMSFERSRQLVKDELGVPRFPPESTEPMKYRPKDDALITVLIGGFATLALGPLAGFFAAFFFVDRNSDQSE
jgi:hypothetical protein